MSSNCLSGCGPCVYYEVHGKQCEICAGSEQHYCNNIERQWVQDAVRTLVSRGYTVIPPGVKEEAGEK